MRLIPVLLFFAFIFSPISMAFAQETIAVDNFWSFLEESAPAWVVIGLIMLRQISEIIAKTIPDTVTGSLAAVRRIFKILAIYIPNKT